MKVLVVVLAGLLIVGCGKDEYDPSMDDQPPGMPANGSLGKNNNPYEEGSISYAIAKGDIEAVKKHLADGADVNVGNPLNVAIESRSTGRKEIVKLLLAKGSDVNAKNNSGWTPAESLKRTAGAMMLVGATDEMKAANSEIAALLLQHGAKTDADFKHFFPTLNKPAKKNEEKENPSKNQDGAAQPAKPVKELTAEEFVTEVIKSLADGGKQVPFDLSDKVIAIDSGKEMPQERFKEIWPKFAEIAFEEDAPKDAIASKLKIQLSLVEDNSEFLTNIRKAAEQGDFNAMRFMRFYKPQAGDMYCDASKPKEAGKSLVKYEKAFIYIIRKTQGKWRLRGIGG